MLGAGFAKATSPKAKLAENPRMAWTEDFSPLAIRLIGIAEVLGGLGGFAGFFDASAFTRFEHPVLATSTDGVGTKVAIAQAMDRHDTIGFDLIGMLVDDLVVCGAEPLFVTDYIACGKVVPERIAAIVKGIAQACAVSAAATAAQGIRPGVSGNCVARKLCTLK